MPNYELKAKVIKDGLVKDVKSLNKRIFKCENGGNFSAADYFIAQREILKNDKPVEYSEALKVAHADFVRANRLKTRIRNMMEMGDCTFLTLTFKDEVLNETSEKTRRRYVTRYLASQSMEYVGNVDYGSVGGREHYHAIIVGRADLSLWTQGFSYAQHVVRSSDPSILGKYINKLVNHSIKETTKRTALIYPKHSGDDKQFLWRCKHGE